jgi:hypothetical protein
MEKRERQRYDSQVIITWCIIGIGAILMAMLLGTMVLDLINHFKK